MRCTKLVNKAGFCYNELKFQGRKVMRKPYVQAVLSAICATLSLAAYIFVSRLDFHFPEAQPASVAFTLMDFVILLFFYQFFRRFWQRCRRLHLLLLGFSLLLALFMLNMRDILKYGEFLAQMRSARILYVLLGLGFTLFFYAVLFNVVQWLEESLYEEKSVKIWRPLKIAGGILLCWLPVYILLFPGAIGFESGIALKQIYGMQKANLIIPPLFKSYLRIFVGIGEWLSSDTLGLVLYFAIQAFCMAYLLAHILKRAGDLGIGKKGFAVLALLCVGHPLMVLKSFNMAYDTLFGMGFVYLALLFYDYLENPTGTLHWSRLVQLLLAGFLLAAFRNVGLYALLLYGLCFGLHALWKLRWKGLLILLSLGLSAGLVLGGSALVAHLEQSEADEAFGNLSIVIHQLGYSLQKHGVEVLTEEERILLESVLPAENFAKEYASHNVDSIKKIYLSRVSERQKQALLSVWKSLGIRQQKDYVLALFYSAYAYYIPGFYDDSSSNFMMYNTWDIEDFKPYQKDSKFFAGLDLLTNFLGWGTPYGIFLSAGFYQIWNLFIFLLLLQKRKNVLPLVPSLVYGLLLFSAPANGWVRYMTPGGLMMPFYLLLLYQAYQPRN